MPSSPPTQDNRSGRLSATTAAHQRPELFFGLVSPIGVGGGTIKEALLTSLREVRYRTHHIRIINLLDRIDDSSLSSDPGVISEMWEHSDEAERYQKFIAAGDRFCQLMGGIDDNALSEEGYKGQDALVGLAIDDITSQREQYWQSNPEEARHRLGGQDIPDDYPWIYTALDSYAYILRSLKRPGEVDRLRRVYGDGFFLISAYSSHSERVSSLSRKIAASGFKFNPSRARFEAERLIKIDQEEEGQSFGQNVRNAFAKADFFVDSRLTPDLITAQIQRFIRILFGHQFFTPTRDEQGMALAFLASLRSSHISRQVGAAITRPDGSVVAIGCNDVPAAGGGLYWPDYAPDARDFQLKKNASFEIRREVVGDILRRLKEIGYIREDIADSFDRDPKEFLDKAIRHPRLKHAKVMDAIEYDRSVHAEMAALTDAARHGVSVKDCTLYSTTFPCHNCARHIVAAGIRRVVYIHPYEKSLTRRLHSDSAGADLSSETGKTIVRFDPFVGISPNLYPQLFTMQKRRGSGERWKRFAKWIPEESMPRLSGVPLVYTSGEEQAIKWLVQRTEEVGLEYAKEGRRRS